MPISADLLLDTSAALAVLRDASPAHERAFEMTQGLTLGLSGHAMFETYSVLTRLPGSNRLASSHAAQLIAREFPASFPLPESAARDAVVALNRAGIAGGSVYDGLVGLAAKDAGIPLLSCDRRALSTYTSLGVDVRLI
ncbi:MULTISPECIES: PIN domain-containing protein [unclassified Microbacterium]|uniref:PIN domain-containing protein n=1 Tax=unclassified Microbacterium TaxID=2609290 RepID=UPI0030101F6A